MTAKEEEQASGASKASQATRALLHVLDINGWAVDTLKVSHYTKSVPIDR